MLGWNFFLICFGVLGCFTAFRTTRRDWLKALLVAVVVICLVVIVVDRLVPTASGPDEAADNRAAASSFLARQVQAIRTDACLLHYIGETPLRPITYLLQMQNFLEDYRRAQAASLLGRTTLDQTAGLLMKSFGDNDVDLTPAETSAIEGQGSAVSLCHAFGKWLNRVSAYDPQQQEDLWREFHSNAAKP